MSRLFNHGREISNAWIVHSIAFFTKDRQRRLKEILGASEETVLIGWICMEAKSMKDIFEDIVATKTKGEIRDPDHQQVVSISARCLSFMYVNFTWLS